MLGFVKALLGRGGAVCFEGGGIAGAGAVIWYDVYAGVAGGRRQMPRNIVQRVRSVRPTTEA